MLPPSSIVRLSDHFGNYVLEVRCRKCRHVRQVDPRDLAGRFGWQAELAQLVQRFRCSKCLARAVDVRVGFTRRPRRWNKNPS
jgi:hypothetical protein